MPTVLRLLGFRFHFYSDEGDEPAHIHICNADGECKFWLDSVQLASNRGLDAVTIRKVETLVYENRVLLREKFYDFHGR